MNWIYNDWNEKHLSKTKNNINLYYSVSELFYSEEFNLGHLFKVPYNTLIDLIYAFNKDLHISFDNFCNMYWFEILMLVDKHNEFIEEQNNESEGKHDIIAEQQAKMENMYRNQQQNQPKFDMKVPDFSSLGNFNNFKL